jgi:HlyD family secretion protein
MRRRLIAGVCVLVTLIVATVTTLGFVRRRGHAATPPRTFTVRKGDVIATVQETGTVESFTRVEVKSKVGGRILSVAVEEGQRVQAGQLLAEIDRSEVQSQVNQIQAQIAAARARLAQAETELRYQTTAVRLAQEDAEQGVQAAAIRLTQIERQSRAQPDLTRSSIAQAEASHRAAEASLAALRESTHPQMIADARSAYAQAQANSENAARRLARARALAVRGFVPEDQVDDAQRDADNASSQRDAARERVDTLEERQAAERREAESRVAQARAALDAARSNAVQDDLRADDLAAARATYEQSRVVRRRALAGETQIASRHADVTAAGASVKQLEDQLAEVMVRLRDTIIRAPLSGTVTKRYIEAGELVTSGIATFSSGMPIAQIADLTRMRVACSINEVDVARVRVGQRAEITLDAARGQRYAGRVVSVAPAAVAAAPGATLGGGSSIVKFLVRIAVDRPDERLRPGMSADVDIITAERRSVLRLPLEAVDTAARPARVQRLVGEQPSPTNVETGLKNETHIEIRSGLKEGDRVRPASYRGTPRRRLLNIEIQ